MPPLAAGAGETGARQRQGVSAVAAGHDGGM
jgi:hypothetical protein